VEKTAATPLSWWVKVQFGAMEQRDGFEVTGHSQVAPQLSVVCDVGFFGSSFQLFVAIVVHLNTMFGT
jgi:hypothetical protein